MFNSARWKRGDVWGWVKAHCHGNSFVPFLSYSVLGEEDKKEQPPPHSVPEIESSNCHLHFQAPISLSSVVNVKQTEAGRFWGTRDPTVS